MCTSLWPKCMSTHYVHAWCAQRLGEGIRSGSGVTGAYKSPCGLEELNLGPLEEQPVLLLLSSLSSPI